MNFKVFIDDFTKRWSTVFLALIAMTSIFFATYGAGCILVTELFPLQKDSITHLTNPLEIIIGYTIALSPITSLIAYIFSIPTVVILKTHLNKLKWTMICLIIILTIIICKLSFPYTDTGIGTGGSLYLGIIFILGSPILLLDFIIYLIILCNETNHGIRVPNSIITENKYYKFTILASIILFFLFFAPFIFPILIRIFEKILALFH